MLADVPLYDDSGDRLGFKAFANAIAGVIDSPNTATPLVMVINAKWGAGKTTLGQMIRRRLEAKAAADGHSPHATCWFNSWLHDDAPSLSGALAADVAQAADKLRPLWRRMFFRLPTTLCSARQKRIRAAFRVAFGIAVAIVAISILAGVVETLGPGISNFVKLSPQVNESIARLRGGSHLASIVVALVVVFYLLKHVFPVAKSLGEFVKDPQTAAATASVKEVRLQLGKLIKQATPRKSKFVIFIDDLDRCRPPRSVDVLEAVSQLFNQVGVVTVIMTDL